MDCRTYTKEELAAELGINGDKASNITRKLDSLGVKYSTEGRARNYRITILNLPTPGLKEFAKRYLEIDAVRFEDKLKHFLYLILMSKDGEVYANMPARSLEWNTAAGKDTIQEWMYGLIDCGLLQEETLIDVFYATKKVVLEVGDDKGNYEYTQFYKEITREEYERAVKAYNETYQELTTDIENNPDMVPDEAQCLANQERKAALDGWWANHKIPNYKIVVNKKWEHYAQLISLLEGYEFQDTMKMKTGNLIEEEEAWKKRVERWESEKAEKRKKLAEKNKPVEEFVEAPALGKLKSNADMETFVYSRENMINALLQLREKFGLAEGVLNCYE